MKLTRTVSLLLAASMTASTASALETQSVPRGGLEIDALTGAHAFEMKIRNDTGEVAQDVTVKLYNTNPAKNKDVPRIYELDITSVTDDKVDDDDDGVLAGPPIENDIYDGIPSHSTSSVLTTSVVAKGGTVTIRVVTNHKDPFISGTKARILFSKMVKGKHKDLCMAGTVDPFGPAELDVPAHGYKCNYELLNQLPHPLDVFHVLSPVDLPIAFAELEAPFDQAQVTGGPFVVEFVLPPLLQISPGQAVELNLEFQVEAQDSASNILVIPGPANPGATQPYGQGCSGTGNYTPIIGAAGNLTAGGAMTFWIDRGLGSSPALLIGGFQQTQIPLPNGCDLLTTIDIPPVMLPLSPGGPGSGSIAFPIILPGGTPPGLQFHLQAFVADPGMGGGYTTTNGVQLNFN